MIREIPYARYDRFLGHVLSESEREELTVMYEECQKNKLRAAGCCCFATSGTFIREAEYIKGILEGNVQAERKG